MTFVVIGLAVLVVFVLGAVAFHREEEGRIERERDTGGEPW